MTFRLVLKMLCLVALTAFAPAFAQQATPTADAPPPAISDAQRSALAILPSRLFDIPCMSRRLGDESLSAICLPRNLRDLLIGVTSHFGDRDLSVDELSEQMRESFHMSGNLVVVSERTFIVPSAPEAVGMRGEYRTGSGHKLTWSVSYRGNLTRVLITAPDDATAEQFEAELLEKVFGPGRYLPRVDESSNP